MAISKLIPHQHTLYTHINIRAHTHQRMQTHLQKGIKDPPFPIGIVLLQTGRPACVGGDHQTLHLDQQGAYGVVLPTQGAEDVTAMCLLELKILLKENQSSTSH